MPDHLWFTDDPEASALLATDPFALLMGVALDQQVTVQKAFAGPYVLKQRVGTLDPRRLAEMDLEEAFRQPPAIHRFPGSMAKRIQEIAQIVTDEYGGDAARIWTEAADSDDLLRRLTELPGFGSMTSLTLAGILARRFGVAIAEPLVPNHAMLGDVDSPEALEAYQAAKRAHKRALKERAG
jgi:uncharacterized HhH-GPD family protein